MYESRLIAKITRTNGEWEFKSDSCGCCTHTYERHPDGVFRSDYDADEFIDTDDIELYEKHLKEQLEVLQLFKEELKVLRLVKFEN